MRRIRQASMRGAAERRVTPYTAPVVVTAVGAVSYESSSLRRTSYTARFRWCRLLRAHTPDKETSKAHTTLRRSTPTIAYASPTRSSPGVRAVGRKRVTGAGDPVRPECNVRRGSGLRRT